jgi:hypothetical protein
LQVQESKKKRANTLEWCIRGAEKGLRFPFGIESTFTFANESSALSGFFYDSLLEVVFILDRIQPGRKREGEKEERKREREQFITFNE